MSENTVKITGNTMTVETSTGDTINMIIDTSKVTNSTAIATFRDSLKSQWEGMDPRVTDHYAGLYGDNGSADKPLTVGLDPEAYRKGGAMANELKHALMFADPNMIPQALPEGAPDFMTDSFVPGGYIGDNGELTAFRIEDVWF